MSGDAGRHCLIDSNVLVYMHDIRDPRLQQTAIRVYERLSDQRRVALSTQCLTEFLNTVTRKLPRPMPTGDALTQLNRYMDSAVVHPVTATVVRDAARAMATHQMSVWDALIWAVAFRHGIPTILTQDAQSRPVINGVRYLNPFDPGFDIESL